jgi:hypothetical protein
MNGVTISGGSTNQRHIFDSLDYTMSILLTTLFGKKFARNLTNFIQFKKSIKEIYNPNIVYNSKESIFYREFNSIIKENKLNLFIKISKSILYNNVKLTTDKILP